MSNVDSRVNSGLDSRWQVVRESFWGSDHDADESSTSGCCHAASVCRLKRTVRGSSSLHQQISWFFIFCLIISVDGWCFLLKAWSLSVHHAVINRTVSCAAPSVSAYHRICFRWVIRTEIAGLLQIVSHSGSQRGPKSWWTGQSSGTEAASLFSSDVTSAASETRLGGQVEWETVLKISYCGISYCQTVRHRVAFSGWAG